VIEKLDLSVKRMSGTDSTQHYIVKAAVLAINSKQRVAIMNSNKQ